MTRRKCRVDGQAIWRGSKMHTRWGRLEPSSSTNLHIWALMRPALAKRLSVKQRTRSDQK